MLTVDHRRMQSKQNSCRQLSVKLLFDIFPRHIQQEGGGEVEPESRERTFAANAVCTLSVMISFGSASSIAIAMLSSSLSIGGVSESTPSMATSENLVLFLFLEDDASVVDMIFTKLQSE